MELRRNLPDAIKNNRKFEVRLEIKPTFVFQKRPKSRNPNKKDFSQIKIQKFRLAQLELLGKNHILKFEKKQLFILL